MNPLVTVITCNTFRFASFTTQSTRKSRFSGSWVWFNSIFQKELVSIVKSYRVVAIDKISVFSVIVDTIIDPQKVKVLQFYISHMVNIGYKMVPYNVHIVFSYNLIATYPNNQGILSRNSTGDFIFNFKHGRRHCQPRSGFVFTNLTDD